MADAPAPYLLRPELEALTDTKQPKRMCAWLTARGWVFEPPQRRGEVPKVARAYHDARMSGTLPAPAQQRRSKIKLDWMLTPTTS